MQWNHHLQKHLAPGEFQVDHFMKLPKKQVQKLFQKQDQLFGPLLPNDHLPH